MNIYVAKNADDTAVGIRDLVVCADDFGLMDGIDEGISELAAAHRLSAVSCISLGDSFQEHISMLIRQDVDIGLHLNFTERTKLSQVHSPLGRLIATAYFWKLNAADVVLHIHAQLDAFEKSVNQAPDFVDGHQHVHQLPVIREALIPILRERYPGSTPWIRSTRRPSARNGPNTSLGLKPFIIEALGQRALEKLCAVHGMRMNKHLLGVYDFSPRQNQYRKNLETWLGAAESDDLLMIHPANRLEAGDAIAESRLMEYHLLRSPDFLDMLTRHHVAISRLGGSSRGAPSPSSRK